MPRKMTPEENICILLTIIFDEGINKYDENFKKLILRLNEFYDTNKVDIINYFTKAIMYLPIKTTIYSNALYSYNKPDITNEIFKKLIEELNKTKNSFIFIRTFIFIFGLIHFNVIPNQYLIDFIKEVIAKKNVNLMNIIIRSIFLIYRKNYNYQFLSQYINIIYESNIISKDDLILKTLYNYSLSTTTDNDKNIFSGFYIKDLILEEKMENENNVIPNNVLNEMIKINYDKIFCPALRVRELDTSKEIGFNDVYYELLIMSSMEAFKNEPYKGAITYLFGLPELYYNIVNKEQNNNINPYQFIIDNFTYASLDFILYPLISESDLCYIINYIIYILKEKKAHFKILIEENKEQNIYISFISSLLLNENFIPSLSPIQLNNLIIFLYHLMSNIPFAKKDILTRIQKIYQSNNDNDINISKDTIAYFLNSFYEKISNLIHKDSVPEDIYFPDKNTKPNTIESITNLPYFKELYSNINTKIPFKDFNKKLFEGDGQNEVLYTFIYCLLNSRNSALSVIYDLIDFYSTAIADMINGNNNNNDSNNNNIIVNSDTNDKQKIILKVIFDVYGHSPLHYIYIINLLAFKNLLNHITVINFIFTEKLFQKKENGLTYSYYKIINNSVDNCYTMLNKFDEDFQNLAKGFSKASENQRKEMQQKMEYYDFEVAKLKKQKDVICDEVLQQFMKLYEISEGLGGQDYKLFIQKIIQDEILLFQNKYNVNEELVDKARKLFK